LSSNLFFSSKQKRCFCERTVVTEATTRQKWWEKSALWKESCTYSERAHLYL